jgi:DNA-binding NarL/FixJ family response regulator
MTTILIVDDHAAFRFEARQLLEAEGFVVVGEAGNGRSAIAAADELRPDVVLLDISLPDIEGFAVAEQLSVSRWPPLIVLTSSRDEATYGPRIAASPAAGFVQKDGLSGITIRALVDRA